MRENRDPTPLNRRSFLLEKVRLSEMESLAAYIPIDRRQAMVRGEDLPDRMKGAVLFADISGFTPLTEALVKEFGPRRGAEELTKYLNAIYGALIAEVHCYQGSVVGFSGDAITCWFDGDNGLKATACALTLQQVVDQLAEAETPSDVKVSLAIKEAVAVGPVRRFRVGDPTIQYIDVLAGAILDRMAEAEKQARRGEVILGLDTLALLTGKVEVLEWREQVETGKRFAVVAGLTCCQIETTVGQDAILPHLTHSEGEFLTDSGLLGINYLQPLDKLFVVNHPGAPGKQIRDRSVHSQTERSLLGALVPYLNLDSVEGTSLLIAGLESDKESLRNAFPRIVEAADRPVTAQPDEFKAAIAGNLHGAHHLVGVHRHARLALAHQAVRTYRRQGGEWSGGWQRGGRGRGQSSQRGHNLFCRRLAIPEGQYTQKTQHHHVSHCQKSQDCELLLGHCPFSVHAQMVIASVHYMLPHRTCPAHHYTSFMET